MGEFAGPFTKVEPKVVFVTKTDQERCLFIAHWRRHLVASGGRSAAEAENTGWLHVAAAERDLATEYLAVAEAAVAASQNPISAAAFVAEFNATKSLPSTRLDALALARWKDWDCGDEDTTVESAERLAARVFGAVNGLCETLTLDEIARRL
jgi:hypothetical protein